MKRLSQFLWGCLLLGLVACDPAGQTNTSSLPTNAAIAANLPTTTTNSSLPPTWTPEPNNQQPATSNQQPATNSRTPRPTNTPYSFPTRTPIPSRTPTLSPATNIPPTSTLPPTTPTNTPPPINTAINLLPNPSFEEGWYHIDGIPELQVANQWQLQWDSGENPLDDDPWNAWVRPESRVLTEDFLPSAERDLFIWDGDQTVKIFKGAGAISFRLLTSRHLDPGTYVFTINVFPDLIVDYTASGEKIWAPDPLSGEVRFLVDGQTSNWTLPIFGERNTLTYTFTVESPHTVTLGVAIRGRWAILNNGWFLDDWSLYQVIDS